MHALAVLTWRSAVAGRWAARVIGTLMFFLFLAFFFGEGPPNFFHLTAPEKLDFVAVLALFLGLAAAWKWEGWGGLATLCGFALMVAVDRRHVQMWAFVIPAVVGAVHILCWTRLHAGMPEGLAAWQLSRTWTLFLVGALGVFVLLCANEMFGEPPFMTSALAPGPELATVWKSAPAHVSLLIHPDGSVTGSVGDMPVNDTRVINNRSWFGKLMHWRDDYRINGSVSGDYFVLRLVRHPQSLDGWIWKIPKGSGRDYIGNPSRITLQKD